MESSAGGKENPSRKDVDHNLKEESAIENITDSDYRPYEDDEDDDDDDDMGYEEFCSNVLKPQSNEIVGGISLRDLCEGKEVMFEMTDKFLNDEEYYKHEVDIGFNNDDVDDDDSDNSEEEEPINSFIKSDVAKYKEKQTAFYLTQSFESLASKMTSITDNDCVKKEVIISGIGKVVPENSYIVVHYNLFKETSEEPFDSTYLRKRPEKLNLGQCELIPGLEIALKTMKKKENSRFFIHWNYAFGALGCPDRIEPKCNIIADVTLLNFYEIEVPDLVNNSMSAFQRGILDIKLEQAGASDSFEEGNIKKAVSKYKKSVRIMNNLSLANYTEEKIVQDLRVKSLVNLGVCYNKLGQYELACVMCQDALSISHRNTKALFHYARASIALSNFTKASSLLMTLNKLTPNSEDVKEELRKLEQKKAIYHMTSQEFWKRAFMNPLEEKAQEAKDQASNSLCNWSKDDTKGDFKGGPEGSTKKNNQEEEEEISRKFEQNMNLKF